MKFTGTNVRISDKAKLGRNVRIGDGTVIYDHVEIGDDTIIADNCTIGEPTSAYYRNENYRNPKTVIGPNALIRSGTIVYADVIIGSHLETGHRVTVREGSRIGDHCRLGTGTDLQGFLSIGDYCQLHSQVHVCQYSELGDFVFIYPNVVLANDIHPPSEKVQGPSIGSYTQVGIQSSIVGNIRVGEHCLIGAHSLVVYPVADFSQMIGLPAKRIGDVRDLTDNHGKPLYPWKDRFQRGMPWSETSEER